MKTKLSILLAGAMLLAALAGCGPADAGTTQTPAPTPPGPPTQEPAGTTATVEDVFAAVAAEAGGNEMEDMSFALEEFYPDMVTDDLESYGLYMPPMSSVTEEIFIAKVKSGAMDGVKAACESRRQAMEETANFYPGTGNYLGSCQIVTEGDWILFCVCEKAEGAVEAFRSSVK